MAGLNPRAAPYLGIINDASQRYGVPSSILYGLAQQESGFNPRAQSPAGALGLTQFMPATARQYGINPYDPEQAIHGAARYLADSYKRYGNWEASIGSYNMGTGGMDAVLAGRRSMPTETQGYIPAVMANANKYEALGGNLPFETGTLGGSFGGNAAIGFSDKSGKYTTLPTNAQEANMYNDLSTMPETDREQAVKAISIFQNAGKNNWVPKEAPKSVLSGIVQSMQTLGI